MNKIIVAATIAAMSLATTAFAGEIYPVDTGNQQYPAPAAGLSFNSVPTLPQNGQEGAVQTANSLPAGFENGTVEFTQAQAEARWAAQAADRRFARQSLAARHG